MVSYYTPQKNEAPRVLYDIDFRHYPCHSYIDAIRGVATERRRMRRGRRKEIVSWWKYIRKNNIKPPRARLVIELLLVVVWMGFHHKQAHRIIPVCVKILRNPVLYKGRKVR